MTGRASDNDRMRQALRLVAAIVPHGHFVQPRPRDPNGYLPPRQWIYVCINKFSKWIGYKPLVQVTAKKAVELLDDIIHRFILPNSIITDLGSTFTDNDF